MKKKIIILLAIVLVLAAAVIGWLCIRDAKEGREIESIALSISPIKTEYMINEEADFSGLQIYVLQKNGNGYSVDHTACTFSGFDSSNLAENQVITVTHKGFTATFTVSIKNAPDPTPVLTGLIMKTLPKTEYRVGEYLDAIGGIVTRVYSDGSTRPLSLINHYVYGFDSSEPRTLTLTVKYVEDGSLAETTYDSTITE